jgi:formylglycine-generating enzyme required for sulfatase activity
MRTNPSRFCATGEGRESVKGMNTDDFPVEQVSWEEATVFLAKLSRRKKEREAGRSYRLPTEAEWEYACRGGASHQTFRYGNSLSSTQANFNGRSEYGRAVEGPNLERTCNVGMYPPNAFGLYDMHGNVMEWCRDWFGSFYYETSPKEDPPGPSEGSLRVCRGGSWSGPRWHCRTATRFHGTPGLRSHSIGFRAVLDLSQ